MQSNVTQQRVPVHGDPGQWIHVSESPRHVRVFFGGETIADSKRVKLVREAEVLPAYYFPKEDVRTDLFTASEHKTQCPVKGDAAYWSVRAGGKAAENAAWSYRASDASGGAIKDHIAFDWPKMDKWMEEDEELFKHARDPFKRVDALPSRRHVRVVIDGKTVADSADRLSSSRPIIRCATTCLRKTCAWTCWRRARPNRAARTKGRHPTGRLKWATRLSMISFGVI